jgi:16S rRNA U516 pseudouridylate synthase RsuA-like enzyme
LIRVGYGPFHLEDLPVGKVFELSEKDIELIGYNKK